MHRLHLMMRYVVPAPAYDHLKCVSKDALKPWTDPDTLIFIPERYIHIDRFHEESRCVLTPSLCDLEMA